MAVGVVPFDATGYQRFWSNCSTSFLTLRLDAWAVASDGAESME